jgi:hypothetical protein
MIESDMIIEAVECHGKVFYDSINPLFPGMNFSIVWAVIISMLHHINHWKMEYLPDGPRPRIF